MEGHRTSATSFALAFAVATLILMASEANKCSAARPDPTVQRKSEEFIRTSCGATEYPSLCFNSLSSHAGTIQTSPRQLAKAALSVTLSNANATASTIRGLAVRARVSRREAAAVADCIDNMADSVEELRQSAEELGRLKGKNLALKINDLQTWVSAALTDENTCMDGIGGRRGSSSSASTAIGGEDSKVIKSKVVHVAQLTSNALSLVNGLPKSESTLP